MLIIKRGETMKKLFGMLMIVFTLVLSGCSDSGTDTSIDEIARGAGGDLTIWTFTDSTDAQIDLFEKYYQDTYGTELNIESTMIPQDEILTKLLPVLKNGTGPDVFILESKNIPDFKAKGADYVEDLSQAPYNAVTDNKVPYTIEFPAVGDKLLATTYQANPMGIYYRIDIANEIGLDEAAVEEAFSTVEGTLDLCQQLKESGYYCFASSDDFSNIFPFSSTVALDENNQLTSEWEATVQETLDQVAMGAEKGYFAPYEAGSTEYVSSLHVEDPKEAETFAIQQATWAVNLYLKDGVDPDTGVWGQWRVASPPELGFQGGTWYFINKDSDNKSLSWEFIEYVTESDEFAQAWNEEHTEYYSSYDRQEKYHDVENDPFLGNQNLYDVLGGDLENINIDAYSSEYDQVIDQATSDIVKEVVAGNITPDEGLDQIKQKIYTAAPELEQ